jgi:hypothetical protein
MIAQRRWNILIRVHINLSGEIFRKLRFHFDIQKWFVLPIWSCINFFALAHSSTLCVPFTYQSLNSFLLLFDFDPLIKYLFAKIFLLIRSHFHSYVTSIRLIDLTATFYRALSGSSGESHNNVFTPWPLFCWLMFINNGDLVCLCGEDTN